MMLGEYIKQHAGMKFEYGSNDCCTFCADWMVINGMPDPMAKWRGKYGSARKLAKILKKNDLSDLWIDALGEPDMRDPVAGSVGIADINGEEIGGIYSGERWIFLFESGVMGTRIPNDNIIGVWSVG